MDLKLVESKMLLQFQQIAQEETVVEEEEDSEHYTEFNKGYFLYTFKYIYKDYLKSIYIFNFLNSIKKNFNLIIYIFIYYYF
jgi:hypothetical protein